MNPKYKNVFMSPQREPGDDHEPDPVPVDEHPDENSEMQKPYSPGPTITSRLKELGANSKAQTVGAALKDFPSGGGGGTSDLLNIEIYIDKDDGDIGTWGGATYEELADAYVFTRLVRVTLIYGYQIITKGYIGHARGLNVLGPDPDAFAYVFPMPGMLLVLAEDGTAYVV